MLPPRETTTSYDLVWKDGVDTWYGQSMTAKQIQRIGWYYEETPARERPVWAQGLACVSDDLDGRGLTRMSHLPHDFGSHLAS